MSSDFTKPSYEELKTRYLNVVTVERPGLRTGPGTLPDTEASAVARLTDGNYWYLNSIDRNVTPLEADEIGLAEWAELLQVPRLGPVGGYRSQALEVRGTPGALVPAGTQLVLAGSGLTFEITSGATVGANGTILVNLQALSTGTETNLPAGTSLTYVATPAQLTDSARLVLALENGRAEESIGSWRARVAIRWALGAQGGNRADYLQWALSHTFVDTTYVYRSKPGRGWVSVAGLKRGEGTSRVLTSAERMELLATLQGLAPISDDIAVLETPDRVVHVDVRIGVAPSYGFDWNDSSGYTVASYDPDTLTLTFDSALPSDISESHLLVIESADPDTTGANGAPAVVAAITGVDTVVLAPYGGASSPFNFTPAAGDNIYASSVTAVAVREAILNGYNICGTSGTIEIPGINQFGPANPDASYGEWTSDLQVDAIQAAARAIQPGVLAAQVVIPAADEIATEYPFPDDDQVQLLIPGQVIVRRL